jgi:hypothetical protein
MSKETPKSTYFIFFCPKGVSAHPIAMYYDKKKAIKHMHDHGNEYTELRMCGWTEGVLPRWVDTTLVDVPPKAEKKKKEAKNESKDTVCAN